MKIIDKATPAIRRIPVPRLRYSITDISDTEVIFEVTYIDRENLKHAVVIIGNWWICVPSITNYGADIDPRIGTIILSDNSNKLISFFKDKKEKDECVKMVKENLEIWKYEAYGITV